MEKNLKDLTEDEKLLFQKTSDRNFDEIKALLSSGNVRINCCDETGLSPLQHAAFKGDYKMCRLFLDCGADVNVTNHQSNYTALMFAALSGKLDVVSLLLENGADTTMINTVNRTAAQMAAFVGNHDVVSVINNFIRKEEIDTFTEIRKGDKEPRLPLELAKPLHQFVLKTNIHPVRLGMFLESFPALMEEAKKITRVLETLSGRQLNDNGNELLSMKLHHLSFVLNECVKFCNERKKRQSENTSSKCESMLEPLIKHWIKGDNDGFPIALEVFLRQSIRAYPFMQCPLFIQLVRTLAPVEIGKEPSALSLLTQAITGERGMDPASVCITCGEPGAEKKCSACHYVQYCDRRCQKLHWFTHKTVCPKLAVKYLEEKELEVKSKESQECVTEPADTNQNAVKSESTKPEDQLNPDNHKDNVQMT